MNENVKKKNHPEYQSDIFIFKTFAIRVRRYSSIGCALRNRNKLSFTKYTKLCMCVEHGKSVFRDLNARRT